MNKINVVGLGPGNLDYLTGAGIKAIKDCEIAVGGKRQLEEIGILLSENCERYTLGKLLDLIDYIKNNRDRKITVVVSGDTGFYSLLPFLKKYFSNDELEVVPGISSYQYLFSKIGECWQNFVLASAHGRDFDYIKAMNEKEGVVLLTDEKNTPYIIGKKIYESGIRGVEIIVGERLSYPDEVITRVDVENFEELNKEFKMNIVILKKGENYAHL
ncbi:precorrin-6y C5,15-methyltransferase (decarboxylating) subunit CbiE [Fusobacterium varium]